MSTESIESRVQILQSGVYPHYPELFKRVLNEFSDRIKGMDIMQASEYVLAECNCTVALNGFTPNKENTIFIANHPSWFLDIPSFVSKYGEDSHSLMFITREEVLLGLPDDIQKYIIPVSIEKNESNIGWKIVGIWQKIASLRDKNMAKPSGFLTAKRNLTALKIAADHLSLGGTLYIVPQGDIIRQGDSEQEWHRGIAVIVREVLTSGRPVYFQRVQIAIEGDTVNFFSKQKRNIVVTVGESISLNNIDSTASTKALTESIHALYRYAV
ncbi:MAG: hypothetical protein AAB508_02235 [Patescibacteria group bacterium]